MTAKVSVELTEEEWGAAVVALQSDAIDKAEEYPCISEMTWAIAQEIKTQTGVFDQISSRQEDAA